MATLERAIQIAAEAHAGQFDKGGEAYILHPLRVMPRMQSQAERIVAVLHDVVEDSAQHSFETLSREGFAPEIIEAIQAITKLPGEGRVAAARRAAEHPIARLVKLADNAENMDLSRIPNPTEKDLNRIKQYEEVRSILLTAGGDQH